VSSLWDFDGMITYREGPLHTKGNLLHCIDLCCQQEIQHELTQDWNKYRRWDAAVWSCEV